MTTDLDQIDNLVAAVEFKANKRADQCVCDLGISHPDIIPCSNPDITPPGVCLNCSHDSGCHPTQGKE